MGKMLDLSLSEYFERNMQHETFHGQFVITELNNSDRTKDKADIFPMRLKAYSIIVVLSGEMQIGMNYLQHTIRKTTVIHFSVNDIISNILLSSDFTGYLLNFSPELRSEIMGLTSGVRLQKVIQLKRAFPILILNDEEFLRVEGHIMRMKSYIADTTHLYRSHIVKNEVMNLFFDLDNSRWKEHGDGEIELTHTELLREKFREMLVEKCHQHRDVGFYARELCVTPDYLSRVIREYDGGSAMTWIANAVVTEAKYLIRQPKKTINQIASELNFPDQSTFGKFFRKQTGMSPLMYKKGRL